MASRGAPRDRVRWERRLLGPCVAALALAALSQAGDVPILQDRGLEAVFAERFAVTLRFEVVATGVSDALLDQPASGSPDSPVEITEVMPPAGTAMAQGHPVFTATIRERGPESVTAGDYRVELTLDEQPLGAVFLTQGTSDPQLREGARVSFDLGPLSLDAPLFVVSVSAVAAAGWSYTLKVVACPDSPLDFCWQGVGGAIDGELNPTLQGRTDEALDVTITCDASATATHNLRVKDGGGQTVGGPTPDLDCPGGASETLHWVPGASGTYRYECKYHSGTQHGDVEVTT